MVGDGYRSQQIDGDGQRKDQTGKHGDQRQDVPPGSPTCIGGG
jgi:hypothetical protein